MLTYLHLNGLLENWDHHLKTVRNEEYSHTRLLQSIIEAEYCLATLHFLHDFLTDQPVRLHHVGVDRTENFGAPVPE
jgi:hypothetical protein